MSSTGQAPARITSPQLLETGASEPSRLRNPVEQQPSLLPYLQLFWARRRLLVRAGTCALVSSSLLAFLIPVQYQAVTRLMPPDGQSVSGLGLLAAMAGRAGAGSLGGAAAGDLLGVKSPGALFVGILQSQTVQDGLIEQYQLKEKYRVSKIEDARKGLTEHTEVSEDRKSGIITVGVTDHQAKRAAAMAQSYVHELDRLVAQVSSSAARRERIFLEDRLQKVKSDLDTAAKNFSDFASKNTAIDIPAQGKAMVEAAATLQGQLIAGQAELSSLRQIYTENNVRVRAAEARVHELQKKLNEMGGVGTEAEVQGEKSLYPSIRKLPLLGVTYADLYRQIKIQETVYELLTQQYELAKVQEAKEIPTVKVLDPAMVPTKKSFPPRTLIILLGTLLGTTLAMTWVVGQARWNATEDNDPRKMFATEVFVTLKATLPKFSRNGAGGNTNGHRQGSLWPRPEAQNNEEQEEAERDVKR